MAYSTGDPNQHTNWGNIYNGVQSDNYCSNLAGAPLAAGVFVPLILVVQMLLGLLILQRTLIGSSLPPGSKSMFVLYGEFVRLPQTSGI